jgi:hypothetical protein
MVCGLFVVRFDDMTLDQYDTPSITAADLPVMTFFLA